MILLNPASRRNRNPWDDGDNPLWLLTPDELDQLDPDTILESINGERKTISQNPDRDTRAGYTAWGLRESDIAGNGSSV